MGAYSPLPWLAERFGSEQAFVDEVVETVALPTIRAMAEAGLDRRGVYVTNSVKHFKYTLRGKRRIHEKPGITEINACRFWLETERAEIRPALIVNELGVGYRLMGAS